MTTHTSGAADLPEALRLAKALDLAKDIDYYNHVQDDLKAAAAELRRLHALSAGQAVAPAEPLQSFESPRAQTLMRAWQEGWEACRDAEFVGEEAQNDAFNLSATVNQCVAEDMIHATRPAPPAMDGGPAAEVARLVHLRTSRAKRVYVAGPMTGLPEYNFPLFNATAARLRAEGWHVENPAEHGHVEGAGWADYLRYDLSRIVTCGAVHLLPGWSNSKGARLEVYVASVLGIEVQYADGAERAAMDGGPRPVSAARDSMALISGLVTELRKHRFCGDCYPENGWPGVNGALTQYELWKRAARAAQKEGPAT